MAHLLFDERAQLDLTYIDRRDRRSWAEWESSGACGQLARAGIRAGMLSARDSSGNRLGSRDQ